MNKADKILIIFLFILSFFLYLPFIYRYISTKDDVKQVVVRYQDEEVLRVDLNIDKTYTVDGTLGKVEIEVKDSKVRVERENSPYHYCSMQGWVSGIEPIVCLPNHIVVQIESSNEEIDTVIQ